ncbi:MAG TPA: PEP-CTERM sorting domain-containing protein [Phycisphaerae bacterium]|nr:PEP-CTERM sorting domain-containing protein [Phycisphaerae bacterium]
MKMVRTFSLLAAAIVMIVAAPASAGLDSRTADPAPDIAYGNPGAGPGPVGPADITVPLVVAGSPITSIATLEIVLNITHPYVGDHNPITLTKVGGPSITLLAKPGSLDGDGFGSGSNYCAAFPITYTDTAILPSEAQTGGGATDCVGDGTPSVYLASDQAGVASSLNAAFAGVDFNGTWELSIVDDFPYTGGTLNSYTISVTPEPATLGLLGLGAIALIRRRR